MSGLLEAREGEECERTAGPKCGVGFAGFLLFGCRDEAIALELV